MDPAPTWIQAMRGQIELRLEKAFSSHAQTELLRAARYATQGAGHRWRGLLAVASGAIFRADAEQVVLPLAAALEMMHAASLSLDDLPSMDNAQIRRGQPCVHLVFPKWVVDLLPAFLVNLAYHVAAENPSVSEQCRVRSLLLLGEMGVRLAQGQELDLALAKASVSEAALLDCYALKSGSLFAAALAGGALLCGAGESDALQLREAGLKLGQAYQLLDDIADGREESGRCTALSLLGPVAARARAEQLLAEVAQTLGCLGSATGRLQGMLNEVRAQASD
jgi:geranylgeranyl diphosphate synthase, type II